MRSSVDLNQLSEAQLRDMAAQMLNQLSEKDAQLAERETRLAEKDASLIERDEAIRRYRVRNEQLTHEIALLRRHRFGKRGEGVSRQQYSLLEDLVDEDTAAIEQELERLAETHKPPQAKPRTPKRRSLPPQLPRTEIHHEPESTTCGCGCQLTRIGEDVSEKLDYEPGQFSVERHIRGKWACRQCETVTQAPVAPHVIDKGIPTTNLLAQVLISKYADHQPLYRQEKIYARAGVELPRSTLADWVGRCGLELAPLVGHLRNRLLEHPVLHADETPVPMLSPGKKRTHRAYVWAYATTMRATRQALPMASPRSAAGRMPGASSTNCWSRTRARLPRRR